MKYISTLFTEASGKVGNIVASRGKSGQYFRAKVKPSNPKSEAQTNVRANFTATSQAYKGLSDAQRAGWTSLGSQMTVTNSLGQTSTMTGAQIHAGLNGVLFTAGAAPIQDAPSQPDGVAALPTITLDAERAGTAQGTFSLFVRSSVYAGKVQIFATKAVSAGRNSFSDSAFRLLEVSDGLTSGGTDISAAYVAKYGNASLGSKIAVKLVPISPSGFKGGKYHATAIVSIGS